MFSISKKVLFTALFGISTSFLACSSVLGQSQSQSQGISQKRVKLIEAGWERPDSADLLKHLKEIEKTPYDGIVVMLQGRDDDGKTVSMQSAFNDRPWKRQWFQKNIEELKAAKSPHLTDNFVRIGTNPGNVDWFDDAGWEQVIDHLRIAAWVAKEGGLKGICFDPEPYSIYFQMNSDAQPQRDKHSFAQYEAKARQRGREAIKAITSEYPDITLFTFFMNSVNVRAAAKSNVQRAVEGASYNLYPAFINGWLDATPPTVTFVDGNEPAYHYDGELDYMRGANGMRNTVLNIVAPENHKKYRTQVQTGFAFYLDAYVNPETSRYYIGPTEGSRSTTIRNNLVHAAQATDEYIWTWGEKYRWYPTKTKNVNPEYWEEVLPGVSDALLAISNPQRWQDLQREKFEALEKAGKLTNLVKNGDFEGKPTSEKSSAEQQKLDWEPGKINSWSSWQKAVKDKEPGHFEWDSTIDHTGKKGSGSAKIRGIVRSGTFIQRIDDVKPGERYVVRAWQRFSKERTGYVTVRWQDADGKWAAEQYDTSIYPQEEAEANQWQQLLGFVAVPSGINKMVILLGTNYQSPQDTVWYDDVKVFKVSE